MRILRGFLGILTIVMSVPGCSTTGDSLDLGQEEFVLCVPAPEAKQANVIFGDVSVHVVGTEAVTITGVELVEPVDLDIVTAEIVEIGPEESLVGLRYSTDLSGLPDAWNQRTDANGTSVLPSDDYNLVLTLKSSSDDVASALAARISYSTESGDQLRQDTKQP